MVNHSAEKEICSLVRTRYQGHLTTVQRATSSDGRVFPKYEIALETGSAAPGEEITRLISIQSETVKVRSVRSVCFRKDEVVTIKYR